MPTLFEYTDVPVEKGQVLLLREERSGLPTRYVLWTVTSVRKGAKSASVKLLNNSGGCIAEATATFPDGLVTGNWQVFSLSQADLGLVHSRRAKKPVAA